MLSRHILAIIALVGLLVSFGVFGASIPANGVTIVTPADPTNTPKYGKVELLVSLTTTSTQPFNPNSSNGGIDLSATFTAPNLATQKINGFYDGQNWRIRFAPMQTGAWTFTVTAVDGGGSATFSGGHFTCVASAYRGFARIDGTYLRFTEGQAQFAIGHNNGWQYNVEQPTMSSMAAQGENLLSFWMNSPWKTPADPEPRCPIENITQGCGTYNQPACAYVDSVVADAEAAGVYLLPSIWSHGNLRYWNPNNSSDPQNHPWGQGWWSNMGYSAICTASNFFQTTSSGSDTAQWTYQKNFYRYLLARWGYSRAIVGWVALVEIEGTTGFGTNGQPAQYMNPTQATAWCGSVRNYFAANDAFRVNSGGKYPIGVSQTDWTSGAPTWASGCDLEAVDSYKQQTNSIAVAGQIASDITSMRGTLRPALIAEFGASEPNPNYNTYQPTHYHNGLWAGAASGGMMSPLLWCDEGSFPMLTDPKMGAQLRTQLQNLSQFMSGISYIDASGFVNASVTAGTNVNAWSMRLTDRGFGWVQNTVGNIGAQTVTVSGLPTQGTYNVLWYDTWNSGVTPLSAQPQIVTVNSTNKLMTTVPTPTTSRADLAFKYFLNSAPIVSNVAAASPNPVTGTTTNLSALGSDDAGEANLTYKWTSSGPAAVAFSVNNSNAAKNTVATFTKLGSYTFTVTIADATNTSTTSTVIVVVSQTPTVVTVFPVSVVLPENGTQMFVATVTDQFGTAFSAATSWNVSGGGTIDSNGVFKAGIVPGGPFTVTATAGIASGTAAVVIIDTAPVISSVAALPSNVTGLTTALNATVTDDGGEPALTYTWSVASAPAGGGATFSANGTNAAKNSIATFSGAGSYVLSVAATDASGLFSSSTVTVTVSHTPTGVAVLPGNATLPENGTQVYSATVSDQFGTVFPYSVTWSVDSGGSIDGSGFFQAGVVPGSSTVTATAGSASGTASVSIINLPPIIGAVTATPSSVATVSTTLSVSASDDGGEPSLTYTWSAPVNAGVTFSVNGTNAAKNTNAMFSAAGSYVMSVSATDASGFFSTGNVSVTVTQTPTHVMVSSNSAEMLIEQSQQFSAAVTDQFGAPITNGSVNWSATGGSIDQTGLFTAGTSTGTCTVTATTGLVSGNASVTVMNAPPVIQSLSATPIDSGSAQLNATASDDGGEAALTYTWSVSSGPALATVVFSDNGTNSARNATATFNLAGAYSLTLTATDHGQLSASQQVNVAVTAIPNTIVVSPANASVAVNAMQQFSAVVADQFGTPMPGELVTWTADSNGGTINQNGSFTATAVGGPFAITATDGNASATAGVTVFDGNSAPVITGVTATQNTAGTAAALSVSATDDGGEPALTYAWSVLSAPASVSVTFSNSGTNSAKSATATFGAPGDYVLGVTVTDAFSLSAGSSIAVSVVQIPAVTVSPNAVGIPTSGTQQFTATVRDQFGATMPVSVVWTPAGGTIDQTGLFTAGIVSGLYSVTAGFGSAVGSASVTVFNTPPLITALSASPGIVTGNFTSLSATASDEAGEAALTYTWTVLSAPVGGNVIFSDNTSNSAKSATAAFNRAGSYCIQLKVLDAGGLSATQNVAVSVTATPTAVAVSPTSVSLATFGSQQFSAIVTDQFSQRIPSGSTSVSWSANGGTINPQSGLFTATNIPGQLTVTASDGSATGGTATVTVIDAPPVITALTATPSIVTGTTTNLSATASDDGGEPALIYTWSVTSGPANVVFSRNGSNPAKNATATFSLAGTYNLLLTVRDAYNISTAQSVSVQVNQTASSVTISPASVTLLCNATQQFTATAKDQFGQAMNVVWSQTGGAVTSSGLYTAGTTIGNFSVKASASGGSQSASMTIIAGTLGGSTTPATAAVVLSTEGTIDWTQWGYSSKTSFVHKSGIIAVIPNFTVVGTGSVTRTTASPGFTWNGGTPTATVTTPTKECVALSGVGNGFQLIVPATAGAQRLKLYVAVNKSSGSKATGQLKATMSDHSVATFTDSSVSSSSGTTNVAYVIDFADTTPGATLTITWTFLSGTGSVLLEAATLAPKP